MNLLKLKISYKNSTFRSGYTLLELLVVIAIIGILIALGTVSYSTVQKKSRDAKRKSDLKNIQTGLEQYNSVYGKYPLSSADANFIALFSGGLPKDPKTNNAYDYGLDATNGTGYCVCTNTTDKLEITGSGNAYGLSGIICTFTGTGAKDHFCVQNLQ